MNETKYRTEDVEALMTCAATMLSAIDTGTLSISAATPSDEHYAVLNADRMEEVLDRLRETVIKRVASAPIEADRPRAAVEIPVMRGVVAHVVVSVSADFSHLCAQCEVTPADVLGGFVADACGVDDPDIGYCTGGSDERDQAMSYVLRRYGLIREARAA